MPVAKRGQLNLKEPPGGGLRTTDSFHILKRPIRDGQMYIATDLTTRKRVALKQIIMDDEDEGFPAMLIRDIQVLKRMCHINVAQLKEIVTSSDCEKSKESLYMVFEYLDSDLSRLLDCPNQRLPNGSLKRLMLKLLSGLSFYHLNCILHGDIKGCNILCYGGNLKVATFGSVKTFSRVKKGDIQISEFFLRYRAPELLLGATEYGPAIDIWSGGCIFVELLLYKGKPLFPGEDERDQLDKIFELCGSPTEVNWPGVSKLPRYEDYKPTKPMANRLREVFHDVDYRAVELLEKMLTLDPSQRISAEDALRLAYFSLKLSDQQVIRLPGPTL